MSAQPKPQKLAASQDVALSNPSNGQALVFDNATSTWKNGTVLGGAAALTSTVMSIRDQYPVPGSGAYQLIWEDSFQLPGGATTAPVDPTKWSFQKGTGAGYFNEGWGNSELQAYTTDLQNTQITSQGLEITLINQTSNAYDGTKPWSSGKIITKGKFACTYGKVEVTAKVPYGKGCWPAFWMLGDDYPQVPWPGCGEIDIMEIGKNGEFNKCHGTLHGPGYAGALGPTHTYTHGGLLGDAFHTYGVEWLPDRFNWYVDSTVYATRLRSDIPQPADWVYDHPFYIILNLAVSSSNSFTGPLDVGTFQTATFNGITSAYARMIVQNVRVYQKP